MTEILVKNGKGYTVEIGRGLLQALPQRLKTLFPKARRFALITDSTVKTLYADTLLQHLQGAGLDACCFAFPAGEAHKNGATYLEILNFLAEHELTRSDVLLALGGGVVGDMVGFTAATYLRAVPYVQIPTTVLAAVDSSVGGKTAIDLPAGKNLAGAFYPPRHVCCDLDTFQTLPPEIVSAGCAEIIKYGMLSNAQLLDDLQAGLMPEHLEHIVATCVGMKRDIVERDEFDLGERQLLNFGHTLGHAMERLSDFTISHGEAVAVGMVYITRASIQKGLCPPSVLDVLLSLLDVFHLPNTCPFAPEALLAAAQMDKKRQADTLTLIVPTALGKCVLHPVPLADLHTWAEAGGQA